MNLNDEELVKLIKEKASDDAFLEICKRYEKIFYKVCQKYSAALSVCGVSADDIFQEKNYIIFHCVKTFEPNKKTKLGTWIGNYARYLCLNSINARRFILPTTHEELCQKIEEKQISSEYFNSSAYSQENYNYVINLLEQIQDDRVIEIFKLRYLAHKKMIWADIARKVGVSTQTVINIHNKGMDLLKRKMQSRSISDVL